MRKTAVIGDTHFGARNASPIFEHHARKFFDQVFWPTIKEQGIKDIIHLGDVFDQRRNIPVSAIETFNTHVLAPMKELDCHMVVAAGNHDLYYNDRITPCGIEEIARECDHIKVYTRPTYDDAYGVWIVPWITKETHADFEAMLRDAAKGDAMFGHFEIQGMKLGPNRVAEKGIEQKTLRKFTIWSGHFHCWQVSKNINYLGTPYDLSWDEADGWHGFGLWDGKEMELVENASRIHRVVTNEPYADVTDCIVRVDIPAGWGKKRIAEKLDEVYSQKPADVRVVIPMTDEDGDVVMETDETIPETRAIINEHVMARTDIGVDKPKLIALLHKLYDKAIADADTLS